MKITMTGFSERSSEHLCHVARIQVATSYKRSCHLAMRRSIWTTSSMLERSLKQTESLVKEKPLSRRLLVLKYERYVERIQNAPCFCCIRFRQQRPNFHSRC